MPVHPIPKTKFGFKNWQVSFEISSLWLNLTRVFSQTPVPFLRPKNGESHPLDYLLVTASFGRILPSTMLEVFQPTRRLNVHPSLLPAYRGAAPIQHAIMNNDKKTGVCIIEMLKRTQGIDAGEIWGCESMVDPFILSVFFISFIPLH